VWSPLPYHLQVRRPELPGLRAAHDLSHSLPKALPMFRFFARRYGGMSYLACERLTLCPIQKKLIAKERLSQVRVCFWMKHRLHKCFTCMAAKERLSQILAYVRRGLPSRTPSTTLELSRRLAADFPASARPAAHLLHSRCATAAAEGDRVGERLPQAGAPRFGCIAVLLVRTTCKSFAVMPFPPLVQCRSRCLWLLQVWEALSPRLAGEEEELAWLKEATSPL